MSFIEQVRTSETDEWYTSEDTVEIIVPYLIRGGGITRYYARGTQKSQRS